MTGKIEGIPTQISDGKTVFKRELYSQDSLLLLLRPCKEFSVPAISSAVIPHKKTLLPIADPVDVVLCEPNVLLLDMAEYALDDEPWKGQEEILRIDKIVRERIGLPLRSFSSAQPWTFDREDMCSHRLRLRFTIRSEIDCKKSRITLEDPENSTLVFNGNNVKCVDTGYYVDEAIRTVELPALHKGENILELDMPFGVRTNPEWAYLLGDFGVRVAGRYATLIAPERQLAFGDITSQGLPFYGGNIVYRCTAEMPAGHVMIQVPNFCAPLVSVTLDGKNKTDIAFAPYIADIGYAAAGLHTIEITAYGNRVNTFGPVHNNIKILRKFGPKAWRPEGNAYSYPYCLKPQGIMQAPNLWVEKTAVQP